MEAIDAEPARKARAPTTIAAWAGLFTLSTYAIFAVRGRLLVEGPLDWFDGTRLLAVGLGSAFYVLAMLVQDRLVRMSFRRRTLAALATAAVSAPALLLLRLAAGEGGWSDERLRADELRWLITWLGYFLAWTAFYAAAAAGPRSDAGGPARLAEDDHLWVQRGQQRVRLPVASIEYAEAEGNYARIHADGTEDLVRIPLAVLAKRLGDAEFARVHRSVLCRRAAIRAVERAPTGALRATLASGAVVPVGRRMGAAILDEVRNAVGSPPD
jgi:hypothetical protein